MFFWSQNITFILLPLPIERHTPTNTHSKLQSQIQQSLLQKKGLSPNSKFASNLKDCSSILPQCWYILIVIKYVWHVFKNFPCVGDLFNILANSPCFPSGKMTIKIPCSPCAVATLGYVFIWIHVKQECIPVGCVPPACCPYLPACPGTPPPVNRMTDRCKNITLPQTSFAGGNKNAYQ